MEIIPLLLASTALFPVWMEINSLLLTSTALFPVWMEINPLLLASTALFPVWMEINPLLLASTTLFPVWMEINRLLLASTALFPVWMEINPLLLASTALFPVWMEINPLLLASTALFPGKGKQHQLNRVLGVFQRRLWPRGESKIFCPYWERTRLVCPFAQRLVAFWPRRARSLPKALASYCYFSPKCVMHEWSSARMSTLYP